MNFVSFILKELLRPKVSIFERATRNPLDAQKRFLLGFIEHNKNTLYGREHHFDKINSIVEYQKKVPINDYESLKPYIRRLVMGEENILTKESPIFFSTTSGTTGAPKFIPVTKFSIQKKRDAMNIWIYYIIRDHPDIFRGKILAIVSPDQEKKTVGGLFCGAETGHAYKNIPFLVRRFYALPYSVFRIRDYQTKYYCILRLSMEQDITIIATMNPSTVVLLCQKIDEFKESIIDDIEKGTLAKNLNIESKIKMDIERSLRPNPQRASFLKRLLQREGRLIPADFWPNLSVIACWKGGSVGMYLKEFPKYFRNIPVRDFGYLSSEARCSIPTDDRGCCGILDVNSNFYEFIPREDNFKEKKRTLLCNQLELGKEYFVIITTPGGLYRYDIDDVIKVTGFYNDTPCIEFIQKGLNVVSITGEKLYESQVVEAVNRAVNRIGIGMEFFTACIQWDRIPRYVFLVEFHDNVSTRQKRELLRTIDNEMKVINIEYETKRRSQRLDDPILKVVKRGGFQGYRSRKVEEGTHDGQFKVPQLTKDLDFQKYFDIEEEICF